MAESLLCVYSPSSTDSSGNGYKNIVKDFLLSLQGSGSSWHWTTPFDLFPYSKIVSFSLSFSSISITNYPLDSDVYETKDKVWASCSVNGLPSPYSTTWPTVERNYPASSMQLSSKTESHKVVLDKNTTHDYGNYEIS